MLLAKDITTIFAGWGGGGGGGVGIGAHFKQNVLLPKHP